MTTAHPLQWPEGRPRTARPDTARFSTTIASARDGLIRELTLMDARDIVLSTNLELRRDGLPYAKQVPLDDHGAAAYFSYNNKPMCFACDRWSLVEDNIQAIRRTIEALRGIARWGTGDMMEAAFKGFEALPPPTWRGDLGLSPDSTLCDAERSYRKRARTAHPDHGGSVDAMARLNAAISAARERLEG